MTAKTEAEALPSGPYRYRPNEYDDWGFVRDANGRLIANTCPGAMAREFYDSVKFGGPEWEAGPPQARAVAQLLIDAEANQRKANELAAENERLRELVEAMWKPINDRRQHLIWRKEHSRDLTTTEMEELEQWQALQEPTR